MSWLVILVLFGLFAGVAMIMVGSFLGTLTHVQKVILLSVGAVVTFLAVSLWMGSRF